MTIPEYFDPDCLEAINDVDLAARYATEHAEHRRQYPRLVPATPEQLAAVDALVASWREADRALADVVAERLRKAREEAQPVSG
jgi:protoheme ferro-lyase